MKKILLIKSIALLTILTLIGIGFNPIATSHKIIEETQGNSLIEIEETSTLSQNEKDIELLKKYLEETLEFEQTSDITTEEIIDLIYNMLLDNPSMLRKTIVISQGWGRDINIFKSSKLQIMRDLFYLWLYTHASKTGAESKTFVIRGSDIITSGSIELYRGSQVGFMFRPLGIYLFQKRTIPQLSHTIFVGFSSYVYLMAEEMIQIPIPLP